MRKQALWVCLVFVSSLLRAQHCQIKGQVLDKSSLSVLDSVRIEIYEGNLMYKVIYTANEGRYDTRMFQVIGDVSFRISRSGYEKRTIKFNKLKGDNVIFMDISLVKIPEEELIKKREKEEKKVNAKSKKRRYARPGRRSLLPF